MVVCKEMTNVVAVEYVIDSRIGTVSKRKQSFKIQRYVVRFAELCKVARPGKSMGVIQ